MHIEIALSLWLVSALSLVSGQSEAQVMDRLKANSDYRVPPDVEKGSTIDVKANMFIMQLWTTDEANMEVAVDMYLRLSWTDSRLNYTGPVSRVVLPPSLAREILWLPDVFFVNSRDVISHDLLRESVGFAVKPNGDIKHSSKLTAVFHCDMDMWAFPFDTQECELQMETYFEWQRVTLDWSGNSSSGVMVRNRTTPNFIFRLMSAKTSKCFNDDIAMEWDYPCIMVTFTLARISGHWVLLVYVPSVLLVLTGCLVFWIPLWASLQRIIVSGLLLVTMAFVLVGSEMARPRVGSINALDVWLLACFWFLAATVIQVVALHILGAATTRASGNAFELMQDEGAPTDMTSQSGLTKVCGPRALKRINDVTRYVHPAAFVLFNAIYWALI